MRRRPSKVVTLKFYIMNFGMLNIYIVKIKWAKNIP